MKIASIDVETGGLDPEKDSLLEVGIVLDDLMREETEDLPTFRAVIVSPDRRYSVSAFAGQSARSIWDELESPDLDMARIEEEGWYRYGEEPSLFTDTMIQYPESFLRLGTYYTTVGCLGLLVDSFLERNGYVREDTGDFRLNVAGKNFSGFDRVWLEPLLQGYVTFRHRSFDPAPLYYMPGDEKLPDMQTCLERAGLTGTVPHDAVGDARLVLSLIRRALARWQGCLP